ncbi:MAG: DUF6132 family protein [Bacteroidota bacterium]
MKLTRPMIITGAITLAGAIGGFFYWQQVGCLTGTCPITSSPVISSLYGGVMGFLLAGILTPEKDRR